MKHHLSFRGFFGVQLKCWQWHTDATSVIVVSFLSNGNIPALLQPTVQVLDIMIICVCVCVCVCVCECISVSCVWGGVSVCMTVCPPVILEHRVQEHDVYSKSSTAVKINRVPGPQICCWAPKLSHIRSRWTPWFFGLEILIFSSYIHTVTQPLPATLVWQCEVLVNFRLSGWNIRWAPAPIDRVTVVSTSYCA